ncbi:MAG: hypothetical protein K6G85_07470 [Eubacterium sp.]|nr:hypothetical protein [Eubacterium sp.]
MKKFASIIMSFVLVVSTFTITTTTVSAGETLNVTSETELKAALNKQTPVEAINITESFTISDDCTIQLDPTHINNYHSTVLTILEGVTLTIDNGGKLGSFWPSYEGDGETSPLPNSKVINNGTVVIKAGGATEADFDTNNGDILVKDGGKAVCCNNNNGSVTVEDGGSYITTQGREVVNHGSISIHEGGLMQSRFGSSIINDNDGIIQMNGKFYCGCMGMNGEDICWFDNEGTITGNGDMILYEASHDERPVSNMDDLIAQVMTRLGQETRFENWEDINIYKQITVSNLQQLKTATSGSRTVAGEKVNGDMDTLIELDANITIPKGESIGTMAQITVPEGITLTVNSGAELECGIENYGLVDVKSSGLLATTMGGNINNYNKIVVAKDATIKSQMGGRIMNFEEADLVMNGSLYCGYFNEDGNDDCWFANFGDVCGEGKIYFYVATTGDIVPSEQWKSGPEMILEQLDSVAERATNCIQLSHRWGPWTQTKVAGCEAGEAKATCEVCGAIKTKEIHGKGHTSDKGTVTKKATYTQTGVKTYRCTVCGKVLKTESIAKLKKKKNTLFAKGKTVKVSYTKLEKKKQTISRKKAISVSKAKGTVTYKLSSAGKGKKSFKMDFSVGRTGKITISKGLKPGSYTLKIKITATGNTTYKSGSKTVSVLIKVK